MGEFSQVSEVAFNLREEEATYPSGATGERTLSRWTVQEL